MFCKNYKLKQIFIIIFTIYVVFRINPNKFEVKQIIKLLQQRGITYISLAVCTNISNIMRLQVDKKATKQDDDLNLIQMLVKLNVSLACIKEEGRKNLLTLVSILQYRGIFLQVLEKN